MFTFAQNVLLSMFRLNCTDIIMYSRLFYYTYLKNYDRDVADFTNNDLLFYCYYDKKVRKNIILFLNALCRTKNTFEST